jgi:hypothetical protein
MKDGQPIVDIVPNKNVLTTALQCSLQLVSGLLDINTGIVYFGDTTKCSFGALYTLELNGSQFIAKGCIRNKPGKDQHDDAANVLTAIDTDPVLTCTITDKANAQIELPASLWSGLTRRWMQAMYGTPLARYKLADIEPAVAVRGWHDDRRRVEVRLHGAQLAIR